MPQLADLPRVETVEPVGGADVQQYVTYVRLQDQAIYNDEVPTQIVRLLVKCDDEASFKKKVLPNRGYEARTAA